MWSAYQLKELCVSCALICWKDCLFSVSVDSSLDVRDWHNELKFLFDIASEGLKQGVLNHALYFYAYIIYNPIENQTCLILFVLLLNYVHTKAFSFIRNTVKK